MIYPLSAQQEKAVRIMWNELDIDVHSIVDNFCMEGYPVTVEQIMQTIGFKEKAA